MIRNLLLTMLIIGLWHGASILWVYYGLLQGTIMSLERWWERMRGGELSPRTPLKRFVSWFLTFHFVVFSCLFIRAQSMDELIDMVATFGPETYVPAAFYWALVGGALTHFVPARDHRRLGRTRPGAPDLGRRPDPRRRRRRRRRAGGGRDAVHLLPVLSSRGDSLDPLE